MPPTLGSLMMVRLHGGPDGTAGMFQPPNHLDAYPAHAAATTPAERRALHRQGFQPGQLAVIGAMAAESSSDFEMQQELGDRPAPSATSTR